MRERHLEQTLVAARAAEAARFHSAERHARIGGRNDEIVDENEASLDARGEGAGARDVTGENRCAEREDRGMDVVERAFFVAKDVEWQLRDAGARAAASADHPRSIARR